METGWERQIPYGVQRCSWKSIQCINRRSWCQHSLRSQTSNQVRTDGRFWLSDHWRTPTLRMISMSLVHSASPWVDMRKIRPHLLIIKASSNVRLARWTFLWASRERKGFLQWKTKKRCGWGSRILSLVRGENDGWVKSSYSLLQYRPCSKARRASNNSTRLTTLAQVFVNLTAKLTSSNFFAQCLVHLPLRIPRQSVRQQRQRNL